MTALDISVSSIGWGGVEVGPIESARELHERFAQQLGSARRDAAAAYAPVAGDGTETGGAGCLDGVHHVGQAPGTSFDADRIEQSFRIADGALPSHGHALEVPVNSTSAWRR